LLEEEGGVKGSVLDGDDVMFVVNEIINGMNVFPYVSAQSKKEEKEDDIEHLRLAVRGIQDFDRQYEPRVSNNGERGWLVLEIRIFHMAFSVSVCNMAVHPRPEIVRFRVTL
jgi:hypothetical protein